LPETCAELIELIDVPEFEKAWLQYCRLYNASAEVQKAELGQELRGNGLRQGHARLTAYAAYKLRDKALAARAWAEFTGERVDYHFQRDFTVKRIDGPAVLNPVDEGPGISTNSSAQWGLSGIVSLAYTRALE